MIELVSCAICGMPLTANGIVLTNIFCKHLMPKHEVKVGDKFNLGEFAWKVTARDEDQESGKLVGFFATRIIDRLPQTEEGEYFLS